MNNGHNDFQVRLATLSESTEAKQIIQAQGRWDAYWTPPYVLGDPFVAMARLWDTVFLSLAVAKEFQGNKIGQFLLSEMIKEVQLTNDTNQGQTKNFFLDVENVKSPTTDRRVQYY